jgi:DNA replication licensing factor MCM5
MDRQTVYSLDLWGEQKSEASAGQESNNQVQKKLVDFILSFAVDNAFIYRYVFRRMFL